MKNKIKSRDVFLTVTFAINNWDNNTLKYIINLHRLLTKNFTYFEILIFDNGSRQFENILLKIHNHLNNLRLILLSQTYSNEIVYSAMMENSLGDYVCVLQPDLYNTKVVMHLFNKAVEGSDIVKIDIKRTKFNSLLQKLSYKTMSIVFNEVLKTSFIPELPFCGILSKMAVNTIIKLKSKKKFLRYSNYLIGLSVENISYPKNKKFKITPPSSMELLISGLDFLVSNSKILLRISTYLGLVASLLSFLFLLYVVVVSLIKNQIIEGWVTSSLVMGSLFLIMFLILTILSEYVARILSESKNDPVYFIAKDVSSLLINKKNKRKLNVV